MLTEYEVRVLSARMHRELNIGPRGLWQCAAGLLILAALAVAGNWFDPLPNRPSEAAQERSQAAPARDDDRERQDRANRETQLPAEGSRNLVPVAGSSLKEKR